MEIAIKKLQPYAKYKSSGVEWLGDIPENWEVKKLKHLGTIFPGLNGKKGDDFSKEFSEGIKSFIPFTNICNNHKISEEQFQYVKVKESENQNRVQKNDILFLMSSETLEDIAKCSIYLGDAEELYLNSFCKGFRIKNSNINPEFINYLISCNAYRNYFSLVGRGFTRINIKQEFINDATVVFPSSLEEQTIITEFLDDKITKIDQAIAIKQQQIELLKERRQILIHKAVTQGINPNVKLIESGAEWIGMIPEGWDFIKVKNIFKLIIEPAPKNNDFELLSVYTDIGVKPRAELEERGNKASTTDGYWLVKKQDIIVNKLLAWMGAIGVSDYDGVTSPAYDILRAKKPVESYFYHNLFRMPSCKSELKKHSRGIMDMRLRLYFDKFGDIRVPYPPIEEQKKIVNYLNNLSQKIDDSISLKQQEIEKLKEYKISLINSVVTGKVRVN